jgi:hypothetical protein
LRRQLRRLEEERHELRPMRTHVHYRPHLPWKTLSLPPGQLRRTVSPKGTGAPPELEAPMDVRKMPLLGFTFRGIELVLAHLPIDESPFGPDELGIRARRPSEDVRLSCLAFRALSKWPILRKSPEGRLGPLRRGDRGRARVPVRTTLA